MKRKHKTYSRPKRPFDKPRIEEEAGIMEEFGLKNKREIWKAEARIKIGKKVGVRVGARVGRKTGVSAGARVGKRRIGAGVGVKI